MPKAGAPVPDATTLRGPRRQACLSLRAQPTASLRGAVATALGVELPVAPCTHRRAGERALHWLGPDEWLATAPAGAEDALQAALRAALTGPFAVTDVSGAWRSFNLAGPRAIEVLRKSSPCDFHPRAFAPGRCVQTVFAKATALIACNADGDFDVITRTSYADYLRRWLEVAALEHPASP